MFGFSEGYVVIRYWSRLAVALVALSYLFYLLIPADGVPASAASGDGEAQSIYRVHVRDADEARRLLDGGWDLVEARGPDYLLIVGDAADAEALRRQGFTVTLESAGAGQLAPFTSYGGYRTVFEHYQHLDAVAAAYPHLARVIDYGDSWRKTTSPTGPHDLKAICITRLRPGDCALDPHTDKPRFLLMAAIHARELSTSEMAWRWIDHLVTGYGADPDVTWLLDYQEMWVIPVANPDGRFIVETSNMLQRKNANTTHCPAEAFGVDLNRNASFAWGGTGSSGYACDETYRGPDPASEPEEYHLEALMQQLFHDQRGPLITDTAPLTTSGVMLTLHSYSNLVLLPWGWVQCSYGLPCPPDKRAPNDAGLRALGFRMSYFNGYNIGQASELLYRADGTTDDWAYGTLGIPA
ncbi:MAG: M14 family zinc carboxypeptidase, partial [Candidatus Roseilinea sp.]|uniref:M14 family zinc carboxypeptidase n=1 Tax=Candidatus Roseilinea sp. TaxID=2838777 RepID=UPI004048EBBF